jgi:hypothetical protein
MNFKTERTLVDQVFTTKVKFDTFGGAGITPEDEQSLIADFGAPTIDIGSEEYIGKYTYDATTKTFKEDATTGDEVRFIINSLKIEVKEGFEASFQSNAKRVTTAELTGKTSLTKASLIAEAKCILYEKKVKEKLTAAIAELKGNMSNFEKVTPEVFTI